MVALNEARVGPCVNEKVNFLATLKENFLVKDDNGLLHLLTNFNSANPELVQSHNLI